MTLPQIFLGKISETSVFNFMRNWPSTWFFSFEFSKTETLILLKFKNPDSL